jgi:hypothetical protein
MGNISCNPTVALSNYQTPTIVLGLYLKKLYSKGDIFQHVLQFCHINERVWWKHPFVDDRIIAVNKVSCSFNF